MSDGSLSSLHSPTDEKGEQSGREAHRWMAARRRVPRRILAFVTGMTDQELLARNEYLAAENRILKAKLKGLCVPKIRSCNIGDEDRRGLAVM